MTHHNHTLQRVDFATNKARSADIVPFLSIPLKPSANPMLHTGISVAELGLTDPFGEMHVDGIVGSNGQHNTAKDGMDLQVHVVGDRAYAFAVQTHPNQTQTVTTLPVVLKQTEGRLENYVEMQNILIDGQINTVQIYENGMVINFPAE